MLLCMRTTIDMPDRIMRKAKVVMAKRNMTFRALVVDALEKSLNEDHSPFVLRDASAGYDASANDRRTSADINRAIDDNRQPRGFS